MLNRLGVLNMKNIFIILLKIILCPVAIIFWAVGQLFAQLGMVVNIAVGMITFIWSLATLFSIYQFINGKEDLFGLILVCLCLLFLIVVSLLITKIPIKLIIWASQMKDFIFDRTLNKS